MFVSLQYEKIFTMLLPRNKHKGRFLYICQLTYNFFSCLGVQSVKESKDPSLLISVLRLVCLSVSSFDKS